MIELTDKEYEQFGREFLKFYLENGFGVKSKSDIDCAIYDILCHLETIDDSLPALIIGRKLYSSSATITKCKEYRFYNHKIDEEILKKQVRNIIKNNFSKIYKGKFVFSVGNLSAKLYIEEILLKNGGNYDYTNNPSNISLSCETFIFIAQKVGFDMSKICKEIEKDTNMVQEIVTKTGSNNVLTILNNNNISSENKVIEFLKIIEELGQCATTFMPKLLKFFN